MSEASTVNYSFFSFSQTLALLLFYCIFRFAMFELLHTALGRTLAVTTIGIFYRGTENFRCICIVWVSGLIKKKLIQFFCILDLGFVLDPLELIVTDS